MTFNDDELAALQSGMQRVGVFFRLDTDPVVLLWLGAGKIEPGVNAYDSEGQTYIGFGEIQNIPTFKQLLNGAAERVEFTLSGVSGDVLAMASGDDADQVKGKRVAVGSGIMNQAWSMLGPVRWSAYYVADFLAIEQRAADPMQPMVRTLSLSCGTRFTGRRRPSYAYFSDQDQQARYPGDLACSKITQYAHGYPKQWPTFS